jgi:predicted metal-dependent enzyme (double-stranded beta helix superfamily)
MSGSNRLRDFVREMTLLVGRADNDEDVIFAEGELLLADLIAHDDWLPDAFAEPSADGYRQYLLHCDPLERFSVVSFVWGPGAGTPIHDHTVWGLIGMLRGSETSLAFDCCPDTGKLLEGEETKLEPGMIERVSPKIGDVHVVNNAFSDRPSISIHVYGANIGAVRRHVFSLETGEPSLFIIGYTSTNVPNIWDRSQENNSA